MVTRFVEATDGVAYGKFLVCRLDADDLATESALPDAPPGARLLTHGGRRRLNDHSTLVVDLQTGQGASWTLEHEAGVDYERRQHDRNFQPRLCPLHLPFLRWLARDGRWAMGRGDVTEIPRFVDLTRGAPE